MASSWWARLVLPILPGIYRHRLSGGRSGGRHYAARSPAQPRADHRRCVRRHIRGLARVPWHNSKREPPPPPSPTTSSTTRSKTSPRGRARPARCGRCSTSWRRTGRKTRPRSRLEIEGQRLVLSDDSTVVKRGAWEVRDAEIPDIVTRAAAIDRLKGLAAEQPENRDRIAAALCLYVRETSKTEEPALPFPKDTPPDQAAEMGCGPARRALRPGTRRAGSCGAQCQRAHYNRSDRRQPATHEPQWTEPFSEANLREVRRCSGRTSDLSEMPVCRPQQGGVAWSKHQPMLRLKGGADLRRVPSCMGRTSAGRRLQLSDLSWAKMQGANLSYARMQGANLQRFGDTYGANLNFSQMEGARLYRGRSWQCANISWARMQGANLSDGADGWGEALRGRTSAGRRLQGCSIQPGCRMPGAMALRGGDAGGGPLRN